MSNNNYEIFNEWISQPIITQNKKNKKNEKPIINYKFEEASKILKDPFWIEKFKNAAIGKFPPKFNFIDNKLIYNNGYKSINFEYIDDLEEFSNICIDFFRCYGSIFSELDVNNSIKEQELRSKIVKEPLIWNNCNKKIQESLILYFISYIKEIINLNEKEIKQLKQIIKLGIITKFFGKNNIIIENNRIQKIEGLLFDKNKRYFYINPELKPLIIRNYSRSKNNYDYNKDTIPQFRIKFNKYIESLIY